MSYGRFCNSKWTDFSYKIFVVINQKICDLCGQKLVWVLSITSTTNTPYPAQHHRV